MVYKCSCCGEVYEEKLDALNCCNESVDEVSHCCHANIVLGSEREYPLGGRKWHIDYGKEICEECGKGIRD